MSDIISTIPEPDKSADVVQKIHVLAAGGGPGGIGAAVSAARNGADTELIERHGYSGGAKRRSGGSDNEELE